MYPLSDDVLKALALVCLKALFFMLMLALVGFGLSSCDPESLLEVVS